MGLVVPVPTAQRRVGIRRKQHRQRNRFNVAVAEAHVGLARMTAFGSFRAHGIGKGPCADASSKSASISDQLPSSPQAIAQREGGRRRNYLGFLDRLNRFRSRELPAQAQANRPNSQSVGVVTVVDIKLLRSPRGWLAGRRAIPDPGAELDTGLPWCSSQRNSGLARNRRQPSVPVLWVEGATDRRAYLQRIRAILGYEAAQAQTQLPYIVETLDLLGTTPDAADSGEEQRREDGHDGDHHEQFDEGETTLATGLGGQWRHGWMVTPPAPPSSRSSARRAAWRPARNLPGRSRPSGRFRSGSAWPAHPRCAGRPAAPCPCAACLCACP